MDQEKSGPALSLNIKMDSDSVLLSLPPNTKWEDMQLDVLALLSWYILIAEV